MLTMLSQIHKRNTNSLIAEFGDGMKESESEIKVLSKKVSFGFIDGMLEMVEGMKISKPLPNDISTEYKEMSERYNLWTESVLDDLKSLLLAQREIIENEK